MGFNKFVYYGETKFDISGDTVTKETLLKGQTAHDKDGELVTGECEYDVNSTDATVAVGEMLENKTAYARGVKLTGIMPNRGTVNGVISKKDDAFNIENGFHVGDGKVSIDPVEKGKLIPANIKAGVTILDVEGTYGGEAISAQTNKNVTPGAGPQVVLPDEGFDYLSQVTVEGVPYREEDHAGGKAIFIG